MQWGYMETVREIARGDGQWLKYGKKFRHKFFQISVVYLFYMISRGKKRTELAACSTIWSESIQSLLG
jgi:hypothetical protein